jgi:tetratricopeptide (TPR) repeat protein
MMKKEIIENRQIRIFISSTFRDMQAERSYLVTKVFPTLRRYSEERGVSIFELDLRWGISEEEAKQGKVFDICLKEVRETKPFFIGLLGERYGWIPTEEERKSMSENTTVFEDFPWVADELTEGASITEIEFQEGVLRSLEKMEAYFYLRSPEMETPAEFRENKGSHEEKKLLELKKTLFEQRVYPVKEYDSIERLGALVEKDFKALVDELFPEGALSLLEKERCEQHIFLANRTRVYVPNPAWEAKLDEFADSAESAIVISGESGMGKSALIANWVSKRQGQQTRNEKIIYHFIGASQSEGDYRKITKRLIEEVRDIYNTPAKKDEAGAQGNITANSETKNETDKQTEELQNLLFSLAENEKLIIAFDGIDRLFETDNAKLLNWLPPYPRNVKIIFSTTPDDASMEAFVRRGYQCLDIGALPFELIKQLVNNYLSSFSKTLSSAQVERIAADKESENPLALLAILDELRIFGVHEKIDWQIDEYLATPDLESLFALILQHTEEIFSNGNAGKNLVQDILSLITVSRYGLSETEILELSGAAPLYWSQLANSMAGHLTTMNGLVSFSNRIMRNAAKKRYLSDITSELPYRSRISSYMETNGQISLERKCDELAFQLFEQQEWKRLYNFLLDYKVFLYISKKDIYEINKYWRFLCGQDSSRYTPEKYFGLEKAIENNEELLVFCGNVMMMLIDLGDHSLSLKFGFRLKEICEEKYAKNSEEVVEANALISVIYMGLGDYKKALECLHENLEITKGFLGKNHLNTARVYCAIGICYHKLGNYQNALKYHQEGLEIKENLLGKNHLETATSYAGIGTCYNSLGDRQKALKYYHESLDVREKLLGKNHPNTARSYDSIGAWYYDLGDYKKALEYYNESLAIYEKILGTNHLDTAQSYDNIGLYYLKTGDFQRALEHCCESLETREKLLGKNHLDTARSYYNIGAIYSNLGDHQKAIEYCHKSLAIREKLLGKNHLDTAHCYNNLGAFYSKIGDYQNALKYNHESLVIYEKFLGKNHANTALNCSSIGLYYFHLGNFQKALGYYLESLEINNKLYGKSHPDTAASYLNIGSCYLNMVDYQKALEYYLESLAIYEKILGKNHLNTVFNYNSIGLCHYRLGNFQKALEYYLESLEINNKLYGKSHSETASSYYNIASCYSKFADYQKALKYYHEVLAIRENILGKTHSDTASSYISIGSCYLDLRDYQKALKYYNQALSIYSSLAGKEKEAESIRQIVKKLRNIK